MCFACQTDDAREAATSAALAAEREAVVDEPRSGLVASIRTLLGR